MKSRDQEAMEMVKRITAQNASLGQVKGKSFPSILRSLVIHSWDMNMFDSFITLGARLTLVSLFVLMLALAGAGA